MPLDQRIAKIVAYLTGLIQENKRLRMELAASEGRVKELEELIADSGWTPSGND